MWILYQREFFFKHLKSACVRYQHSYPKDHLKVLRAAYLVEGKFASESQLAEDLAKNVVYNDPTKDRSGLIALNKQAGVGLKSIPEEGTIGIEDALPTLAEILKVRKLIVVKSVQKYSSGIVLLSSKDQGKIQVDRSLNRSRLRMSFRETYFALTNGFPRKNSINEVVDMQMERIRDLKSPLTNEPLQEPVINRILFSRSMLNKKKNDICRVGVDVKVISKSQNGHCSLLRIEPFVTQWNFVRVYCADLLSPVIGDHLFSYRAKMLMGKMIRVSPQHSPDPNAKQQNLPLWLLNQIGLRQGQEHELPLHLHLGRMYLPGYFGANKNLIIHARPRPYFQGTAEMLGIEIPDDLAEDNEERQYILVRRLNKQSSSKPEVNIIESSQF